MTGGAAILPPNLQGRRGVADGSGAVRPLYSPSHGYAARYSSVAADRPGRHWPHLLGRSRCRWAALHEITAVSEGAVFMKVISDRSVRHKESAWSYPRPPVLSRAS